MTFSEENVLSQFEKALGKVNNDKFTRPSNSITGGSIFKKFAGNESSPLRGQLLFVEGTQYKGAERASLGLASELAAEFATSGHLVVAVDLGKEGLYSKAEHAYGHMNSKPVLGIRSIDSKPVDRLWEDMKASAPDQCVVIITGLEHMAVGSVEQIDAVLQELSQLAMSESLLVIAFSYHLTLPKDMYPSLHYRIEELNGSIVSCVNQNTDKYTDFLIYQCLCRNEHRRVAS